MGQKIHPFGFRVGISKDWKSRWFVDKKDFANNLVEDYKIREFLKEKFSTAGLESIEIERSVNEVNIIVKVSKPGIVIGRGGAGIDAVEKELKAKGITKAKIRLTAIEVRAPELSAQLVADYISRQLKRRVSYRRVATAAITTGLDKGAKGMKIKLSGLLSGGNTIARSETFSKGPVPTQTLRANIDYAQVHCKQLYGTVGIKVWIYKGEF